MLHDRETGLGSLTAADEVLLTKAIVHVQRRVALQNILDSLIAECEAAEAAGLRIWDWELTVTERKKANDNEIF
jgi:hypothetical protein